MLRKTLKEENEKLEQINDRLRLELYKKEQIVQQLTDSVNNYLDNIKAQIYKNKKAKVTEMWLSKEENVQPTEIRIRCIEIPSFRIKWVE